jgi:urease accessory protein
VLQTAELPAIRTPTVPNAPGAGVLRVGTIAGRSLVNRMYATSPLRLLTPRNHGHAAWVYTSTYGGGLLDGDAIRLRVHVDPGAAAFLSTQSSTKIYRGASSSVIEATLADRSLLVVFPDPVVCFARSHYRQTQRFDLSDTAGVILVDWFTAGRSAMGERWAFECYASRTEIRRDGRLVWLDALRLDAGDGRIDARMGRFDVMCTVALVGVRLKSHAEALLTQIGTELIEPGASIVASASPLDTTGCVARVAGRSVEGVRSAIRRYLSFVAGLLGDDPWTRRW